MTEIEFSEFGFHIDSVSGPASCAPYPGLEPASALSSPALFTFPETGQRVRVAEGPDGEPWFVARDVCDCLELVNTTRALCGLDDDEKCELSEFESSGRRPLIISEPGLYSLILRSRKPQARTFKRWITHDVLPTLRRTGHYSMPAPSSAPAAVDADLARLMLDRLTIIEQQLAPLKEKAGRFDAFLSVDGTASLCAGCSKRTETAVPTSPQRRLSAMAGWCLRPRAAPLTGVCTAQPASRQKDWMRCMGLLRR